MYNQNDPKNICKKVNYYAFNSKKKMNTIVLTILTDTQLDVIRRMFCNF